MKKSKIKLLLPIAFFFFNFTYSQEWKNLKHYKKDKGNSKLCDGCWLVKDRKKNTETWRLSNKYNLKIKNGNEKYVSIAQKRDFYIWFDKELKRIKHEIKWIGIASVAAAQLSKVDIKFIRYFIVRNKEVVQFLELGSNKVFNFAFPHLREVYFSTNIIKGLEAKNWDLKYGLEEQCQILEPLYNNLSLKAVNKLEKMAKGRGVFSLEVPKDLKFEGDLLDCELRYEHGINKLFPYYLGK